MHVVVPEVQERVGSAGARVQSVAILAGFLQRAGRRPAGPPLSRHPINRNPLCIVAPLGLWPQLLSPMPLLALGDAGVRPQPSGWLRDPAQRRAKYEAALLSRTTGQLESFLNDGASSHKHCNVTTRDGPIQAHPLSLVWSLVPKQQAPPAPT
jgi:hypothetical protein